MGSWISSLRRNRVRARSFEVDFSSRIATLCRVNGCGSFGRRCGSSSRNPQLIWSSTVFVAFVFAVLLGLSAHGQTRAAQKKAQVRAIWVTRWDYKKPEDVRLIVSNCAGLGFNVILFQVRGNGTVFYPSQIEPWAWELTSDGPATTGTDPGWDPLKIAIAEAHKLGVEPHAYVNVRPGQWPCPETPRDGAFGKFRQEPRRSGLGAEQIAPGC